MAPRKDTPNPDDEGVPIPLDAETALRSLLKVEPDAEAVERLDGWMCEAAEAGDLAWIEDLLAQGGRPNARMPGRGTALELARAGGHDQVVQALIAAGTP
jgi:hypothetical protein